ncbi:MAG: M48 family metallopeptidase [Patescibacteria group bacterium]|jgi:predicted metal-dependent hydrolase|nr:M48 family metallopeptidase [Patescibacteria group bacterium]
MEENTIKYKLRRGVKTKRLSISIHSDSRVVVSAPRKLSQGSIDQFLKKKKDWIKKSLDFYKNRVDKLPSIELDSKKRKEIELYITAILEEINKLYNFKYTRVFVKNHKSRWGSCSSARNLNFNYRIISLPNHLAEYIIAHELCHLKEMNHSKRFWDLVALSIPNHKERRRELKKIIF